MESPHLIHIREAVYISEYVWLNAKDDRGDARPTLTIAPLNNYKKNIVVTIDMLRLSIKEKKILILLPPPQHISEVDCQTFFDKIAYIASSLVDVSFYFKSHPADRDKTLSGLMASKVHKIIHSIDHLFIENDPAFWAYENGYIGLISYRSSAIFYSIQLGRLTNDFLCLDLFQEISNIESPLLFIARQLASMKNTNITESTELFLSGCKQLNQSWPLETIKSVEAAHNIS